MTVIKTVATSTMFSGIIISLPVWFILCSLIIIMVVTSAIVDLPLHLMVGGHILGRGKRST